jgi:hypothetical protein
MYQGKNVKVKVIEINNAFGAVTNKDIEKELNKFIGNSKLNVISYQLAPSGQANTRMHISVIYEEL